MTGPRLRPRFELVAPGRPADVLHALRASLEAPDAPCVGHVLAPHARLAVHEADRHFWSPHLEVEVTAHPDGAHLRGLFGPHPSVWTFFAALYAVLIFAGAGCLIFGGSQWMLGQPPWALWGVPAALFLLGGVYGITLSGQNLAQEQMWQLRSILEHAAGAVPAGRSPAAAG